MPESPVPPSDKTVPLITIRMSAEAAEKLASACGWAAARAWIEHDDEGQGADRQARAGEAYEWLSWGQHWLINPEARGSE